MIGLLSCAGVQKQKPISEERGAVAPIEKWGVYHNDCRNNWYKEFKTQGEANSYWESSTPSICPGCGEPTPDNGHYTVRKVSS